MAKNGWGEYTILLKSVFFTAGPSSRDRGARQIRIVSENRPPTWIIWPDQDSQHLRTGREHHKTYTLFKVESRDLRHFPVLIVVEKSGVRTLSKAGAPSNSALRLGIYELFE